MRALSPFTPTEPIAERERLVGRDSDIAAALTAVCAGRNLIVSGERGVGKTSLAMVVASTLRGAWPLATSGSSAVLQAAIAVFSCTSSSTLEEVTDGLLHSLSRAAGYDLTASRRQGASVAVNIGPIKGEGRSDIESRRASACAAQLVEAVATLRARGAFGTHTPLVFILDEVDQLPPAATVGVWVRTTKEILAGEGLNPVSFVVVGQKTLVPRLRREHASVLRAFDILWLQPLSAESCQAIVAQGETISGVQFDPEIRAAIALVSRGFPAVVQRLADSCVAVDRDSYVDVLDFEDGLAVAVERIRGEDTLEAVSNLSGQLGRRVLALLSERQHPLLERDLPPLLPDPPERVSAVLRVLEDSGVIERDDDGIRVADRLLAAYVALEETRKRDLRDVRALAAVLGGHGWKVRAIGPSEHRGVDLIASRRRWMLRRRIGAVYVGDAGRVGEESIARWAPQLRRAMEIYALDEIWLIGRGRVPPAVDDMLKTVPGLLYLPWDFIGREGI